MNVQKIRNIMKIVPRQTNLDEYMYRATSDFRSSLEKKFHTNLGIEN